MAMSTVPINKMEDELCRKMSSRCGKFQCCPFHPSFCLELRYLGWDCRSPPVTMGKRSRKSVERIPPLNH
jgi:hypothetical protein